MLQKMYGRWENKAIGDVAGEYSTTVGERNTKKSWEIMK